MRWVRPCTAWSPALSIIPERLWMAPACCSAPGAIIPWPYGCCAATSPPTTPLRKLQRLRPTIYSANCWRNKATVRAQRKNIAQLWPWLAATAAPRQDCSAWSTEDSMTSVRMDKWLWAARFFKTRALAARACDLGRVLCNGQPAKPAREVRVGNMLRVTNEGGEFEVEFELRPISSEASHGIPLKIPPHLLDLWHGRFTGRLQVRRTGDGGA